MTAAHDHTNNGSPRAADVPLRGVATLVVDLFLPVALYYGLRAGGVDQLAALLIGGLPPAVRAAFTVARTRRVDAIGALVLAAMLLAAASSLIAGSPRTLLVRSALLGFPFGLWMLASLRASRPLTYEVSKGLLATKEHAFERAWAAEPSFRRVWRLLTVLWGCALLLQAAANVAMAYALPVDAVPGLDSALWLVMFILLQIITQTALHKTGAMRMIFARPANGTTATPLTEG